MFQIHYMGRRRAAGLGKFGPGTAFRSSVSTREVLNAFTAVWTQLIHLIVYEFWAIINEILKVPHFLPFWHKVSTLKWTLICPIDVPLVIWVDFETFWEFESFIEDPISEFFAEKVDFLSSKQAFRTKYRKMRKSTYSPSPPLFRTCSPPKKWLIW